jgi:hypothetical protein
MPRGDRGIGMDRRGIGAAAVAALVLAVATPVAAVADDDPFGPPAQHCAKHSLRLTGPHRAVAGSPTELRVTRRADGRPARGARIYSLGVKGSLEVNHDGRLTMQFGGARVYRVVAHRGSSCSNMLVVHVHR